MAGPPGVNGQPPKIPHGKRGRLPPSLPIGESPRQYNPKSLKVYRGAVKGAPKHVPKPADEGIEAEVFKRTTLRIRGKKDGPNRVELLIFSVTWKTQAGRTRTDFFRVLMIHGEPDLEKELDGFYVEDEIEELTADQPRS